MLYRRELVRAHGARRWRNDSWTTPGEDGKRLSCFLFPYENPSGDSNLKVQRYLCSPCRLTVSVVSVSGRNSVGAEKAIARACAVLQELNKIATVYSNSAKRQLLPMKIQMDRSHSSAPCRRFLSQLLAEP